MTTLAHNRAGDVHVIVVSAARSETANEVPVNVAMSRAEDCTPKQIVSP